MAWWVMHGSWVLWQAVPEELVPKVSSMLVDDIVVTKGGHQSCGIIGTKYMFEVLSAVMKRCDTGQPDRVG